MISPRHIPLLLKYFDGIDHAVSRRMLRPDTPDEPLLTQEFLALMDERVQALEGTLSYDAVQLNEQLKACGEGIEAKCKIEAIRHTSQYESFVSQSDFALIVIFDNGILRNRSWRRSYLVQAKRLYRHSDRFDVRSKFGALNKYQELARDLLQDALGSECLLHWLYCPPISGFDHVSQMQIRALHADRLASHIFDYSTGLAMHDQIKNGELWNPGMWVSSLETPPHNAALLHGALMAGILPFSWFMITLFGARHQNERRRPGVVSSNDVRRESLIEGIARGEPDAVQELLAALNIETERRFKVLPSHSITITISVGNADASLAGVID